MIFLDHNLIHRSKRASLTKDTRFFRSLLAHDVLCYDVGANIGAKTEALLRIGARVISFEPNPDVLSELCARCRKYPKWTLVRTAVGEEPAVATLYSRRSHAHSSLDSMWEGEGQSTHEVPLLPLDTLIKHYGLPAYCKIDVEGWELPVLRGLSAPIPLISFEYHLTHDNIAKTIHCLDRLSVLGQSEVNFIAGENSEFQMDRWMRLEDFVARFPGELPGAEASHYGDIFVKREGASLPIVESDDERGGDQT